MSPSVSHSLTLPCADLTDVTVADENTNSILTDNANRVIQGKVAMHVVANFGINVSGAIWLPNLQTMQVAPSGGQFWN